MTSQTTTLELPRNLFGGTHDDNAKTTKIDRRQAAAGAGLESRLATIEARLRAALARDQVFALAMLCLALLFALGIAGM
jgi:hypothetical protein